MTRRPRAMRIHRRPPGAARRFIAALSALVAVLVGIPALLVTCSRLGLDSSHPFPHVGSVDEVKAFFERDLSATEIAPIAMRGLLIAGWLLWLAMAVSVLASILEATGSGLRASVPQFALFAGIGRWIAAGLTAFSSLAPNFVSAGSLASPRPFTVSSAAMPASTSVVAESPVAPGHARVQRGESIETFAQRTLGDANRWPEIWDLNRNHTVGPAGEVWAMAWKLSAGWDLRLPEGSKLGPDSQLAPPVASPSDTASSARVPTDDPDSSGLVRHHVVAGDSYWSIARSRLGETATGPQVWDYTQSLMDANAARLGHDDPAMLHPGDEVELPATRGSDLTPPTPVVASVPHVLVEPGDSYWSIAEDAAGDGATPQDVLELTNDLIDLNNPRLGHASRPLIHPGDVVFLQDPSSPMSPSAHVTPAPEADPVEIEEFAELVESVHAEAAPLPPPTTAPTTTVPAPVTTSTLPPLPPDGTATDASSAAPSESPVGIGEAALLATGVVALLAAKRRARLRAAEPPARLPVPRPETAATERMLRRLDDGERLMRVDIALRAVAAAAATTDHRVVAVRSAHDGTVEVTLSGPVRLDEPWTGSDRVWTLPRTVPVEALAAPARSVGAPCIALVQVGIDESGWDVLVDLEAVGVLAVEADDATADSVIRAVAIGLACSEFAEVAHLVGVGVDESVFLGHRHAQSAGTLDEGIELAATLAGVPASNHVSTFTLRARQAGGERWEPAVVLVASAEAVATSSIIAPVRLQRGRVALVAAGAVAGAAWRLHPNGSSWTLDPLGIRLVPVGVEHDELTAIVDAVEGDALVIGPELAAPSVPEAGGLRVDRTGLHDVVDANVAFVNLPACGGDSVPIPALLLPGDWASESTAEPSQAAATLEDPSWAMMVRLMGPVDLVDTAGRAAKFERSKTLELLAWMVTHRDRSTRVGARTALWEQDVRDATFANVVSEARRAMARHLEPPEGDEWLRRTLTDELSLHELVVSDAQIVEARYRHGRRLHGAPALTAMRPAVELVRDLPFSGASYLWPELEGVASNLILLATNLTAEYAKRALEVADFEGVFWATSTGLRVLPGQEALISLRMQAHADAGDLSGVRMEWESYERVINADPWSDGEPAPKLVSLRKQLLSTS